MIDLTPKKHEGYDVIPQQNPTGVTEWRVPLLGQTYSSRELAHQAIDKRIDDIGRDIQGRP